MKISVRKRKHIDALESGSLSDLAFLLIIFFIVIAVFNVNMGFLLSIPKKNSSKIVNTQDIIRVSIKADNSLLYDSKEIDMDNLEEIVSDKLKNRPNMTLFLLIDPDATYQNVVNIIDIIRKMDVDNFSFKMKGT